MPERSWFIVSFPTPLIFRYHLPLNIGWRRSCIDWTRPWWKRNDAWSPGSSLTSGPSSFSTLQLSSSNAVPRYILCARLDSSSGTIFSIVSMIFVNLNSFNSLKCVFRPLLRICSQSYVFGYGSNQCPWHFGGIRGSMPLTYGSGSEPFLWLMDPDPGGPKTCGSGGSGSGTLVSIRWNVCFDYCCGSAAIRTFSATDLTFYRMRMWIRALHYTKSGIFVFLLSLFFFQFFSALALKKK
jgi:hypothetical protein